MEKQNESDKADKNKWANAVEMARLWHITQAAICDSSTQEELWAGNISDMIPPAGKMLVRVCLDVLHGRVRFMAKDAEFSTLAITFNPKFCPTKSNKRNGRNDGNDKK